MRATNYYQLAFYLSLAILCICMSCQHENLVGVPDKIDFNVHVRPILSGKCFACHGPDAETREAGLRLDNLEGATAELESGHRAVVPGRIGASELVRRISSEDWEEVMPPPESKKTLEPREIAILRKWIRQGAEWKEHWAFIAPEKVQPPRSNQTENIGNEIDLFIQDALAQKGLAPVAAADKAALLRRISLKLVGLPPSKAQLENFINDPAEDSFAKVVDQLLSSPRFGERWARHWMDLVRYSETRGHEFDYPVNGAWHYRDYLIRAFNADVPYDQLVREQLAGDLLEEPRLNPQTGFNESLIGTAFYVLGEGKHSPVDIKEEELDRIENIIDVTTKTFQALTVACARCHDHKFDPIPTKDFYALYGIMESSRLAIHPVHSNVLLEARADSIVQLKRTIKNLIAEANGVAVRDGARVIPANLKREVAVAVGDDFQVLGDFRNGGMQGWMAQGAVFANILGYPIVHNGGLRGLHDGQISSLAVGKGLIGAVRSPTFIIEQDSIVVRAAGEGAVLRIIIDNFQLIQDPIHGEMQENLDHKEMRDYHIDLSPWKGHKFYVEVANGQYEKHGFQIKPNAWASVEYAAVYNEGHFPYRVYRNFPEHPTKSSLLKRWVHDELTASDLNALNHMIQNGQLKNRVGGLSKAERYIDQLRGQLYDTTFFRGMSRGDYIESSVFIRGNHHSLSDEKEPHHFLSKIGPDIPFDNQISSRLTLAEAILHPDNPLTARVMVNRIWHHLFGRGLVETVDNFGFQGKSPTHPELLDYLAVKFREEGWSIKGMIRYIVLSNAFQRSSIGTKEIFEKDPENLLLSHYPIHRLEAEAIRDALLATSGRIDTAMYGFPVYIALTEFVKGRGRPPSGPIDGDGRRSIYQSVRRNFLSPFMLTFDMPVPFSAFGRRNVTNVPAQSLALMNDPLVQGQAAFWARRLIEQYESEEERIKAAYTKAFAHPPSEEEIQQAKQFLEEQSRSYGELTAAETLEEQIWKDFCHSIFNMKEFIYVR